MSQVLPCCRPTNRADGLQSKFYPLKFYTTDRSSRSDVTLQQPSFHQPNRPTHPFAHITTLQPWQRALLAAAAICFSVGYMSNEAQILLGSVELLNWSSITGGVPDSQLDVARLTISAFNEYTGKTPIYSPHWYGIVEPFRDTTLSVSDPSMTADDDSIAYMCVITAYTPRPTPNTC